MKQWPFKGLVLAALAVTASLPALPVPAQVWTPERNVELVVPSGPGGNLDSFARPIEQSWQELKLVPSTSTIVNRGGGEHAIAYNHLRQRKGDAHVLGVVTPVLLTSQIAGRIDFGYADLTPIATISSEPYVFVVNSASPIRSGRDLIEVLRKNPESLSIAIGNVNNRIAMGLVLQSANVEAKRVKLVSFTGTGGQATAVAGGHVDVGVTASAQVMSHLANGTLRAIAVSSPRRMAGALAAAPTWEEQGHKQGTYQTWRAIAGPPGMTPEQVAYWESVLQKVVQSPQFRAVAEKRQWDLMFAGAAATRAMMEAEYGRTRSAMSFLGLIK